jgi:Na+/melibiose symporter-like transporter
VSQQPLTFWRRLGYGLGPAALGLGGAPMHLLLLYYLTQTLGLRAGLAGLAVGIPKLWDMLFDPALGGYADRLSQRHGRRAPLALAAGLSYVGILFLLFSMPPQPLAWLTMVLVVLLLIAASIAHTVFHVLQLSLADDLCGNSGDRSALFAFSGVITILLTLVGTASAPMLIKYFGGARAGYSAMAGCIALAAVGCYLLFYLAMRDRPALMPRAQNELPLLQAMRATLANHGFYQLMAFLALFGIAAGVLSAFLPFANRYILQGDEQGLAVLGSIVLVMSIAALPLAALIAKRIGTMRTLRLGNALLLLTFPLTLAASYGPMWTNWLAVALFGLGAGTMSLLLQSASIDLAKRALPGGVVAPLGVYLGVLIAGQKLGQSVGGMVAGGVLDAVGFVPGAAQQSASTVLALRLGYTLVPLVPCLVGTLFLRRVRLDATEQAP